MIQRLLATVAIALALAVISPNAAFAEKRVALVIGNSAYSSVARLDNPANDAKAMGELFKAAHFDDVRVANDLGIAAMKKELRAFSERAADADVAVIFFAGHGIEMGGHNYLIPIDAVLQRDLDVEDETVELDRLLQLLEPTKRLKLIILDACRNNPFTNRMKRTIASRNVGRGLAEPGIQMSDTLVAFAQRAGATALDGEGDHSPFTRALMHHLTTPGLDLRIALGRVRDEVLGSTKREQEPFIYGALGGDTLALVPGTTPPAAPRQEEALDVSARADFDLAQKIGTIQIWTEFKRKYSNGFWQAAADAQLARLTPAPPQPQQLVTKPNVAPVTPQSPPAVAQRAALLMEAPNEPNKVKTFVGTVVWRLDNVSASPGQPLGKAVRADIDLPEAKLKAAMIFEKNFDASLSASHTMTVVFTPAQDSPVGAVKEIKVPQMRALESQTTDPLGGIPVPIVENSFLVGLSRGAVETQNIELIKQRDWVDIPMILQSGRAAKLTFEKSTTGTRAIEDAVAAWKAQ